MLLDREIRFRSIIPNGLYYFDVVDTENSALLLDTVAENRESFARREYEGARGGATGAMHLLEFPSERDI